MIRAFSHDATVFTSNGNRIINALSCSVNRVLNGECTAEIQCSRDYADVLGLGSIVVIDVPEGAEPFRVYELTDTGRQMTVRCKHVFYHDADNCVVYGFNDLDTDNNPIPRTGTPETLIGLIFANAQHWAEYTLPFDHNLLTSAETFDLKLEDCTLREALEKFAELINAKLIYENWTVKLLLDPGETVEQRIEYRKNIKGIEAVYDSSDVCTRLLGIGENNVTLIPNPYMDCTVIPGFNKYGTVYTRIEHFDQDIQQGAEEDEEVFNSNIRLILRGQMEDYLRDHHYPSASYSIDVATAGLSPNNIKVGQRIHVSDERIGLDDGLFTVRATTYDAVRCVLTNIELGDAKLNLRDIKGRLNNALADRVLRLGRQTQTGMVKLGARITSLDGSVDSKQDKILESPGGNKYTLAVDNDGNLTTEAYIEEVPQP